MDNPKLSCKGVPVVLTRGNQRNDCTIRAFSYALCMSYDEADVLLTALFKKRKNKGVRSVWFDDYLSKPQSLPGRTIVPMGIDGSLVTAYFYKQTGKIVYCKKTVGKFIQENPEGIYLISVNRHAFCIIDGVVYGNEDDAVKMKTRICKVAKVEWS